MLTYKGIGTCYKTYERGKKNMTYKPVLRDDKFRKEVLSDSETRAI
jgi:hypothetical protein